jgi:nicotinate-nucleotide--dimethylbenzimidazole phosphoribosyltransferase
MVSNFLTGGAAINALAREAKAEVAVVDIGVAAEVPFDRVSSEQNVRFVSRRVREGTRNLAREEAMTESEMLEAVSVGVEEAERAVEEGIALLGMGEMGIGNTTAASAVTAAITGLPPSRVTGRGTGVDDAGLAHKIETVERALDVNQPRSEEPLDILRKVGGLEIAGLCGLCIGAAVRRRAVVADGFIATSAAALAVRLCPSIGDYMFAAHVSPEPGHAVLLDVLGHRPILNLEMRLGEGTGAALAFNIMGAAVAAFNDMATFESAGVMNKGN